MSQEESNVEAPYFKINQNGIMDIIGNFDPETLADIFYIMKQPEFVEKINNLITQKYSDVDFIDKFSARVATLNNITKVIEASFVHPLQSWRGMNEN